MEGTDKIPALYIDVAEIDINLFKLVILNKDKAILAHMKLRFIKEYDVLGALIEDFSIPEGLDRLGYTIPLISKAIELAHGEGALYIKSAINNKYFNNAAESIGFQNKSDGEHSFLIYYFE